MYIDYSTVYSTLKVIHFTEIIQKWGLNAGYQMSDLCTVYSIGDMVCVLQRCTDVAIAVQWLSHVGVVSINFGLYYIYIYPVVVTG